MKRWQVYFSMGLLLLGASVAVFGTIQSNRSHESQISEAQRNIEEVEMLIMKMGPLPELVEKQQALQEFIAQEQVISAPASSKSVNTYVSESVVEDKTIEYAKEAENQEAEVQEVGIQEPEMLVEQEVAPLPDPEEVYYLNLVKRLNRGQQLSEFEKLDFESYEESHPNRDSNPLDDTGGPSAVFCYNWVDNLNGDSATYTWEQLEIGSGATSMTVINQSDDAADTINWGWNFNFFGVNYTSAYVTTNGYLAFNAPTSTFGNTCRRSTTSTPSGPTILAYWDDGNTSTGGPGVPDSGRILYQDFGDHVTITWDSIGTCCTLGSDLLDYQLQIWNDGRIKLQYRQIQKNSGTSTNGASPTIGIQQTNNTGGGDSLIYHCATAMDTAYTNALDGRAIWFYIECPVNDFRTEAAVEPSPLRVEPGEVFEVIGRFRNVGTNTQSSPIGYQFNGGLTVSENTGVLAQFAAEDHNFAGTETAPLIVGDYPLLIASELATDENDNNDTLNVMVQVRNCYDETQSDVFTDNASTTGAVNDFDATCMGTYDTGQDYVYRWTVTSANYYNVLLTRAVAGAMGLAVHSDCPPDSTTCIRFTSTSSATSLLADCIYLDAGTYYIMVDNSSTTLTYDFTVTTSICACNPNESQSDVFTDNASTTGAVNNFQSTCMGTYDTGQDYMYEWTVSADNYYSLLLTRAAAGAMGLAVHSDCPPDSTTCIRFGFTSSGTSLLLDCIYLVAGTYYIMVDNNSTTLTYDFTLTTSICACTPNDTRTDAFSSSSTTIGSVNDYQSTCMATYDTGEDYVIEWTTTTDHDWGMLLTTPTSTGLGLAIHSSCPPDSSTCIAFTGVSNDSAGFPCVPLDAGTYYIILDRSTTGGYAFTLQVGDALEGRCCYDGGASCVDTSCGACADLGGVWNVGLTCATACPIILNGSDLCADAVTITPGSYQGTNVGATAETGIPACSPGYTAGALGVWYKFIGNGYLTTAQLCDAITTFDTKIFVFTGTCPALVCVGGDDDACVTPGLASSLTWCAEPGVEYLILVTGFGSGATYQGPFLLTLSEGLNCMTGRCCYLDAGEAACTENTELECDGLSGQWTVGLTCAGDPCPVARCCYNGGNDCADNTQLECNALGGTWSSGLTCANACPVTLAGGDLCDDAVPLPTLNASYSGTTVGSTVETGIPPSCGDTYNTGSQGVWYSFVGTGNAITIALCDPLTNYDSEIFVFCGTCPELFCAAGDDDSCDAPGLASRTAFCSALGEDYLLLVTSFSAGVTGTYMLTVSEGTACGNPPSCVPPEWRCCYLDAGVPACTDTTLTGCNFLGGLYTSGSTCAGTPCPIGRCCYNDGTSCENITQVECNTHAGSSWSDPLDCTTACPIPPPNDDCVDAQQIVLVPNGSVSVLVNNTNANTTCSDTCDFDSNGPDVFYYFTVTNCRRIAMKSDSNLMDTHLSIYGDGLCCVVPAICCNDDHVNFGENGCAVPVWDVPAQHPTQYTLNSYIAAELGPGTFYIRAGSFTSGTDVYPLTVYDNGPCFPCEPVLDLTIYNVPVGSAVDHIRLTWTAPQLSDYRIYSATDPNNDGNPDNGTDPDWSVEVTLLGLSAGPQSWESPAASIVNYKNYVVTSICGE